MARKNNSFSTYGWMIIFAVGLSYVGGQTFNECAAVLTPYLLGSRSEIEVRSVERNYNHSLRLYEVEYEVRYPSSTVDGWTYTTKLPPIGPIEAFCKGNLCYIPGYGAIMAMLFFIFLFGSMFWLAVLISPWRVPFWVNILGISSIALSFVLPMVIELQQGRWEASIVLIGFALTGILVFLHFKKLRKKFEADN